MDKKVFYTVSKCGLGVGSTVEMKVIFDHILESGMADEIHHWYGDNQLRDYTTNWQRDLDEIVKIILNDDRIKLVSGLEDNKIQDINFVPIPPTGCPVRNLYSVGERIIPQEYVTLVMKTSMHIPTEAFYNTLIHLCNLSKYQIVLVGERKITPCKEYVILSDHGCMYSRVKPGIPKAIDMTYEETSRQNSVDLFMRSSNLYKHAKYNICINSSGGFSMLCLFGNIIGLTSGYSPQEKHMNLPTSFLFSDPIRFLRTIREKIVD